VYKNSNIVIAVPSIAQLLSLYSRLHKLFFEAVGRVYKDAYEIDRRITITTYQSIITPPLARADILLIDECHRIGQNVTTEKIATHSAPTKIFGFSATPKGRSDGSELMTEALIGPIIHDVQYTTVVDKGFIAPIKVAFLDLPVYPGLTQRYPAIDEYKLRIAKKRWGYWRNKLRNELLAAAIKTLPTRFNLGATPQILVLVETVEHAFRLKELLPDFELVYSALSKKLLYRLQSEKIVTPDYKPITNKQRQQLLRRFEEGSLRKVIATSCWGEGVDFIHLDVVVNAAGTYSSITTIQWAGRGSRINNAKQFGLLIDVYDKWNTWTERKSQARRREYKKHNWEIHTIDAKEILCLDKMQQRNDITLL